MNFMPTIPPRCLQVGRGAPVEMRDCGRVELQPDEQVTLVTESGAEYDIARKSWGFYATPSVNGRLQRFGLRAVLVRALDGKVYVFLVERGKEAEFEEYLAVEQHGILHWLDSNAAIEALLTKLGATGCAKD